MIKVKDGYAKLIGTTYQGSATQVLLSNGGNLEFSSATKANTLVQRNASQHIYATYFNSAISDEALTDIGSVYVRNTSDTFIRRISKTQFYSIIDNKFVTLDTAQTITGVKTFTAGPIIANNASISQNQNSTSNYTTAIRWLKGGASQGTYNPSIGQHNTGGDGNGSICILPYPTETSPWGGTVGLFISKGVLKLDGQNVIHSGNYDQYFGYIGTTKVQKTSATQALTGIASINGRLTINAESDQTRLGFGGVHTVVFGEAGYAHRGYYFRPAYSASGATQTAVYIQNASAATSPTWTTTHTFSANGNATHAGAVIVGGNRYWTAEAYGLQLNNSDIVGANGIYFADLVDGAGEGIHFYRSATTWDTLAAANGLLYFSPNRATATHTLTPLFSSLANSENKISITVGGQNRTLTVAYASNAGTLGGQSETAFYRTRGNYGTIASNIPTTAELATNNGLNGSWIVSYTGASGHLMQFNAGGGSTRYVQLYSYYNSSLYWRNSTDSTLSSKPWKTIVDSANYTGIVLKIGIATKGSTGLPIYLNAGVPTACNSTLTVSITGNAATATKLQTARTINGTSFDGTINITTVKWGVARTITLSGAVTGSASVDGSQNVTIATTYQTGSIDGRYVGGKKTAGHGSSGTAYTADTYSSNFVNNAFVAYAERGSWAYANNGYVSTDVGVNIPLAGTAIFQWGASHTNKTQLYITPYNNSGVSNPAANEMLFYTSNGSGYTSAWTRVLTHRNYTAYFNPANYVTALGTNGNYVTWTKNGATNNITVPYATTSAYLTNGFSAAFVNKWNCNAPDRVVYSDYGSPGRSITNAPSGWNYGTLLELGHINYRGLNGTLNIQLMWDVAHNTTSPGTLWFRGKDSVKGWAKSWAKVITDQNISSILSNYYTKSESDGKYVTLTTAQTISGSKTFTTGIKFSVNNNGDANLGVGDGFKLFYNHTSGSNFPGSYYNVASFMTGYTGFQLACYGGADQALKYRHKQDNGTWHPWLTLAFTSQLKDPVNYYWANIKVSASSSTGTSPTFSTAYASNWFRSTGSTGWYSQTYGGGWHMTDTTYIRAYNNKRVYNANTSQYAFYTSGGMTATGGFWHSAVNSNSYVLLAGGSYKGLGDFAKGNAGSATKGVYVTGGTVTAMTYYLNATVNSGTSGKLAYYSAANALSSYAPYIGSAYQPVYINAGTPRVCSYSFLGSYSQPIVLVSGYFYRSSTNSNSWYYQGHKHSQIGSPTFYLNGGVMRLAFSNSSSVSFISATAQGRRNFAGTGTSITQPYDGSSGDYGWRSEGAYWFNSYVMNNNNTSYLYVRAYRLANGNNDSWYSGGKCWRSEEDAIESVAFTIFGYIYP